ncbi:MAG: hypothetical protein Q8P35_02625 [Candidatus Yanofskybacteria bacterium]|nr:hypothetical protein [Candidatus Yanofskybacteria bacterium]
MTYSDDFVAELGPVVNFGEVEIGQYFCIEEGKLARAGFWHKISSGSANWMRIDREDHSLITGAASFKEEVGVRVLQIDEKSKPWQEGQPPWKMG